jgi:hypothetical protein
MSQNWRAYVGHRSWRLPHWGLSIGGAVSWMHLKIGIAHRERPTRYRL